LLLFPDQWRFDWAGFSYPQTSGTPSLEIPLELPTVAALAARGVHFTQAYVPAPVCAPSRSCLASARDFDDQAASAGVPTNMHDYNIKVPTFYKQLQEAGYWTMTTGKDDLTKGSQLGSNLKPPYKGCDYCLDGDGLFHQKELGWSDGRRFAGKSGVFKHWPKPYCMYGYHLSNQTVHTENGTALSGWEAHAACVKQSNDQKEAPRCDSRSYPQVLYEDDFTGQMAIELLRSWKANHSTTDTTASRQSGIHTQTTETLQLETEEEKAEPNVRKPFFLHVSFPGPHPPFAVTAPMHDRVAGRMWPNATGTVHHTLCTILILLLCTILILLLQTIRSFPRRMVECARRLASPPRSCTPGDAIMPRRS
jgi:arylsulfatase A-like enzyme